MRHLILMGLLITGSAQTFATGVEEKILGFQPSNSGITFQVTSGGCTHPDDFVGEITRSRSSATRLKLIRVRPDPCHSFLPLGIRFKLSLDTLGLMTGEQFIVTNQNGVIDSSVWE